MKGIFLISALLGVLAGPLFIVVATILDLTGLKFDAWHPILISLIFGCYDIPL